MTAPDAREWYVLNPNVPAITQLRCSLRGKFKASHPDVTFVRVTLLGIRREAPWLCIDGWRVPPNDQGPEPTDADIPNREIA